MHCISAFSIFFLRCTVSLKRKLYPQSDCKYWFPGPLSPQHLYFVFSCLHEQRGRAELCSVWQCQGLRERHGAVMGKVWIGSWDTDTDFLPSCWPMDGIKVVSNDVSQFTSLWRSCLLESFLLQKMEKEVEPLGCKSKALTSWLLFLLGLLSPDVHSPLFG